jgi:hypothetical protein
MPPRLHDPEQQKDSPIGEDDGEGKLAHVVPVQFV